MFMKDSLPQQAYNQLADDYARMIDNKPHNAYYDRPAIKSLIYDLAGKKILDAGCGPGVYTEWLLSEGADVVGVDANEKMIRHAMNRTRNKARYIQANLEEPMPFFSDQEFDGVISALTITYCQNLQRTFSEFARVLKRGGWLVFSTEHPFFSYQYNTLENYYQTQEVRYTWKGFGRPVQMHSYHHSLSTITEALSNNDFLIERMIEPLPTDDFRQADSEGYSKLLTFPLFIFMRAMKK
jgi:ubiquinone/menaquinone biosynthesis C-methylase UbiE